MDETETSDLCQKFSCDAEMIAWIPGFPLWAPGTTRTVHCSLCRLKGTQGLNDSELP